MPMLLFIHGAEVIGEAALEGHTPVKGEAVEVAGGRYRVLDVTSIVESGNDLGLLTKIMIRLEFLSHLVDAD